MRNTAFVYHPVFLKHQTGWTHPEKRQRLTAILDQLKKSGLWEQLIHLEPSPAPIEAITRIHTPAYVESLRLACEAGGLFEPDDSTVGSPGTYEAALMAAGGVLSALDAVMSGHAQNAFCAVRPPGHHAMPDRAMGFCFFNNVAIGARYLQHRHGIRKVAIIDWDVHHGNGTQHAFYNDPSVFYFSLHQYPLYPHGGRACETGEGEGKGYTLNVPMPAGATDADYRRVFSQDLKPALDWFQPEFILISAGFDGHRDDPLASLCLTEQGFAELTQMVVTMAAEYCGNRLISVLEGGYHLPALAASVEAHIRALKYPKDGGGSGS
ncbi:MAG: histone deacetylase [bacterium]